MKSAGNIKAKGWLLDVLLCVEKINKQDFSLDDIYAFAEILKAKHPANNNVQAKTRSGQQLRDLRDKGVIEFMGRGRV